MARVYDIVFDCRHPAPLARFWAEVLDGYAVAQYDDAELARLRSLGVFDVEDDPSVLVEKAGDTPRLFFQAVSEAKTVKNRVHLDLRCDDLDAERDRLVGLGARVLWTDLSGRLTLADPEGNEFCLDAR